MKLLQTDFDLTELTNALVEVSESMTKMLFLSKVVDDTAETLDWCRGLLKRRETEDYVRQLTAILRKRFGITAITGSRQSDCEDNQYTDKASGLTG